MRRWPLFTSFLMFVALCMSAAYWAMQFIKPAARTFAAPPPAALPLPKLDAAANLLGGRVAVAVATNYQLKGVLVGINPADSVAILSANNKPAKAVRVNAEVMPGVIVKEVQRGYVLLSDGGAIKRVDLPAKTKGPGGPPVAAPVGAAPQPPSEE